MKEQLKVQKSKDYTLYLLHNELTRKNLTKRFKPNTPKPNELPKNNFMNQPVYVAK